MSQAAFIAGDWGTSHLRLSLCAADGQVLAQRSGPGIAQLRAEASNGAFHWPTRINELLAPWTQAHGPLSLWLCGMIGSSLGWATVPYVNCPTALDDLARHLYRADSNAQTPAFIAPGLACRNQHDAPDVMRGEETQILGALQLNPTLHHGEQLLCLPGTHTKWVSLQAGQVVTFTTAITGELFAVLKQHSVLIQAGHDAAFSAAAFTRALQQAQRYGDALQQLIFECRSRQLQENLSSAEAGSYLSGLLIGMDVQCALRRHPTAPVTLIGAPALTQLYAQACQLLNRDAMQLNGEQASLAGLTRYYLQRH